MYRTHTCNDLTAKEIGQNVTLAGWINKVRSFGKLVFVDLRDRYGITQIVYDKSNFDEDLKREFVIQVEGLVKNRQEGQINKDINTGEIEIESGNIKILSKSKPIPIDLDNIENVTEDNRLKYRYLDLRRKDMQKNIILRSKITKATRDFFEKYNFVEIETPMLAKSTPEGARDYLVPSRVNNGKFYALPQSPQIFKQLLMVSGFDRYMQIVKCFRDEDLRADRQPEFTQVDIEMSFVEEKDVLDIMEEYIKYIFKEVLDYSYDTEFPRMTFEEAMEKYGSDKPDIRFDLELFDLTNELNDSEFKVFKDSNIKGIFIEENFSNKQVKKLEDVAKLYKAKGLIALSIEKGNVEGNIVKFLNNSELEIIKSKTENKNGTIFIISDSNRNIVNESLGKIRLNLAKQFNLIDKNSFGFVWVHDFPLFEWSEEEKRFSPMHHPFTSPHPEDFHLLDSDLGKVRSVAYDLAINGTEAGGGSIRIHSQEIQAKIFKLLGISDDDAKLKFGFLLDAFEYGVPPHGGIAFGLDRLAAIMTQNESIKEVIAFPKNKAAVSPLDDSPSNVDDKQLEELGIKINKK